jgi:hypothetical protein
LANRRAYEVQKVQPRDASIEPGALSAENVFAFERMGCRRQQHEIYLHGVHPLAAGWNLYVATYETHAETIVHAAHGGVSR